MCYIRVNCKTVLLSHDLWYVWVFFIIYWTLKPTITDFTFGTKVFFFPPDWL